VADRPSSHRGDDRGPYTLPSEYDAEPPEAHDDHTLDADGPRVTLRERDDPVDLAVVRPEAATNPGEPPMSRRELREQRERAGRQRRGRPRRFVWARRAVLAVVIALLVPVGISYGRALSRPGTDTVGIRTVEWIRDHGGNGIVNTVERWWYTNNPPPAGGRPHAIKVPTTAEPATTVPTRILEHLTPPTGRVPTPAAQVEPNEGVWAPTGRLVQGIPAVYTTYVRPNAVNTSYYVGVMWLDTRLLRAKYVVGLQEPGGGPNPWGSQVPVDQRGALVAAFNSGFKMDTARGGAWLDGTEIKPLVNGAASLVIFKDGSATVGVWGRDVVMAPGVEAVRQNLELVVDNGQLNPAMRESDTNVFGATLGNKVKVWRSGVGVTADGALLYVGGPAMSIIDVARTLQAAGAVRAMEMDINSDWVSAYTYAPPTLASPPTDVVGTKLLNNMSRSGDRYLQPGERDFFAFLADPKVETVPSTTTTSTTKPKR